MLLKNFNVLVVDDVPLMCNFLYGVANKIHGCKAYKAFDYKTATDILENEPIDLLITDIELKDESGLNLMIKVRTGSFSETAHDIPIIVFSVNAYRELLQQCMLLDVNDFLVKPVTYAFLTQKICDHLKQEKLIQPSNYYIELMQKLSEPKLLNEAVKRKLSVAIVLQSEQKTEDPEKTLEGLDNKENKRDFLYWPENITSGYYQLDRRLKNLAFTLSCFYNVYINNRKPVAIDTERKRACVAADYLLHIAKNMRQRDPRPEFWSVFQMRLDKLQPLMDELATINLKHNTQVSALLKKIAYWWMQTCNWPLVQIEDAED
ncbi:response regulator [Rheinheimera salexigens]|uniref:Histidine kinase n=1 Tax=Rheinheimera salexigens TaxID=1628148 RepID=A0A1E7Q6I8_9GAMM|nr:response regulator [Rheinheimera salexigens]OEY69658.1 histidine kinase [Rheinheimera salexigens]